MIALPTLAAVVPTLDTGDLVLYAERAAPDLSAEPSPARALAHAILACADWLPLLHVATSAAHVGGAWRPREAEWTGAGVLVRVHEQVYVLTYAVCNGDQAATFSLLDLRTHLVDAGARCFAVRHLTRSAGSAPSTLRQALHSNIFALCQKLNEPRTETDARESNRAASSSTLLTLHAFIDMRIASSSSSDVEQQTATEIFGNNGTIEPALRSEFRLGAELVCTVD